MKTKKGLDRSVDTENNITALDSIIFLVSFRKQSFFFLIKPAIYIVPNKAWRCLKCWRYDGYTVQTCITTAYTLQIYIYMSFKTLSLLSWWFLCCHKLLKKKNLRVETASTSGGAHEILFQAHWKMSQCIVIIVQSMRCDRAPNTEIAHIQRI